MPESTATTSPATPRRGTPSGFLDYERRDPLNFSQAEAAQAKRTGHDPKAIKAMFKRCWEQSDSRSSFAAALWAEGYCLARGERRGFVSVDANGKVWSMSRWCDVKPRDLRARLGEPADLPSTEEAAKLFDGLPGVRQQTGVLLDDQDFGRRRQRLIEGQRQERKALFSSQEQRAAEERFAQQARLPRGLKAAWARLSGRYERLLSDLAQEAAACAARDRNERQDQIDRHLAARRALEGEKHAPDLTKALDEIFIAAVRPDSRQRLVLPKDGIPFTLVQLVERPDLILGHLSQKKASFSELDIKRALAEFIDDPLVLRPAIDKALGSSDLVRSGNGDFTTREYRNAEQKLDGDTRAMAVSRGFAVAADHIARSIREQDARLHDRFGASLSDEQRSALRHILDDWQFSCVVGLAGSGKSTMLETARNAWERQGVRVHGAALSGKAAAGLQTASGMESRTLASLETSWANGYEPVARGDVLVVDEVGMVGTR